MVRAVQVVWRLEHVSGPAPHAPPVAVKGGPLGKLNTRPPGCRLTKVKMAAASEAGGGGGGARAAARFAAGKAAAAAADANGAAWAAAAAGPLRRKAWVMDADPPQRLSDVSRRGFRSHWRLQLPGESGQELSRVLGGGIVPGSIVLVGGEPGVGKSTLLLQMASWLSQASDHTPPAAPGGGLGEDGAGEVPEVRPVLYVSGEESVEQIGSRAERMGLGSNENIYLYRCVSPSLISTLA